MKKDGTYKYGQYLMGNLLREGIDYDNNFSTTISSTGITIFYSLATTSARQVGGWHGMRLLGTSRQLNNSTSMPFFLPMPIILGSIMNYEDIAK
jgi:hypothetical protein